MSQAPSDILHWICAGLAIGGAAIMFGVGVILIARKATHE